MYWVMEYKVLQEVTSPARKVMMMMVGKKGDTEQYWILIHTYQCQLAREGIESPQIVFQSLTLFRNLARLSQIRETGLCPRTAIK